MTEAAVGSAKSVLVAHEGQACISTVMVHVNAKPGSARLSFQGTVKFEDAVQQHLEAIVLAHVDDILHSLNRPLTSFALSALNIGAASSSGLGISVSGLSIDLSVFLALISRALELPIRQDIVFTGHIGSLAGDILPVESLAAKCEAALFDKDIAQLVYPSLESEMSFKNLKPNEYTCATAAIRSCRGKLKLHEVRNTLEIFQKAIEPEGIVLAALRSGFFNAQLDYPKNNELHQLATYLSQNNNKRFWNVLEEHFLAKHWQASQELITRFTKYHLDRGEYPSKFGENLSKLMISLPLYIRKSTGSSPLLSKKLYIEFIQYASEQDHEDISLLHNALYGNLKKRLPGERLSKRPKPISPEHDNLLNRILEQLDPNFMESNITGPFDEARVRYALDTIKVESNAEFLDIITAFYTHMYRHTNEIQGSPDTERLGVEAHDVLNKTFRGKRGYNDAFAEAKNGTRGGLRYVIDAMTEYLKKEAREKHILTTFKENIDPLDFAVKVKIIGELMERFKEHLPKEITTQPTERFAEDYEEIIKAYVESLTVLESLLRRL